MSSPGETWQAARSLRRARLLAVTLFLTAVALTIVALNSDESFVNLICTVEDPEAFRRDPGAIPECEEPFSLAPWMPGVVGLAAAIAALSLTIAIHRRRGQDLPARREQA